MSCFRAWEDWAIYPNDFLINLQNVFLGLIPSKVGCFYINIDLMVSLDYLLSSENSSHQNFLQTFKFYKEMLNRILLEIPNFCYVH